MNDQPGKPKPSEENPGRDSRLENFLRKAAPILAAERGLNERSRVKLRSLSEEMKMPDELFDSAIKELKKKIKTVQPLTRQEQGFVKFLKHQFGEMKRQILSIRMESKAVKIGETKFQISEKRSRELVREVADDHNI